MKRKKTASDDLLADLAKPAPAPEPAPEPAALGFLEYKPFSSTEKWRVEKFELFQAEFGLSAPFDKAMPLFHEAGEQYARGWLIAKMLFGITPMILPDNADPKEFEPKSREEICATLAIEKPQLQAELDALRTLWQSSLNKQPEESAPVIAKDELPMDETIFEAHGFSEAIFDVKRWDPEAKEERLRRSEERNAERKWFIKRVVDWSKMLSEPMAGALVRQTLMNELYLRRLETEISMVMPGTRAFADLQRVKNEIEKTYQDQLEKLKTNFPEMNIGAKNTLRGCFSDAKDAYIEYKTQKSTHLFDRMRTVAEIDVELRQSLQKPDPQYRFGLNMYWVEAMHGLYDPNWRSQIPVRVLKKMDMAGRAAIEAARVELGEAMVDLEKGIAPGEGSQFPDLPEL